MENVKKKFSLGGLGEQYACDYLIKKGYEVICRNYRKRCGEIDIIAVDSEYLLFVEVKTRRMGSAVKGYQAVDLQKQTKIIQTADLYITEFGNENELEIRFDVADIEADVVSGRITSFNYYESAFDTSGFYTIN